MTELIRTTAFIDGIHFKSYNYLKSNMIVEVIITSNDLPASLTVPASLLESNDNCFTDFLDESAAKDNLFDLYFESLGRKNDVFGRYIQLYSILTVIYEHQWRIDRFVVSQEPDVQKVNSTNPHKKGSKETIYTYLRNQVNHPEKNINIVKITNEMEKNIESLDSLVKKAIMKKKKLS